MTKWNDFGSALSGIGEALMMTDPHYAQAGLFAQQRRFDMMEKAQQDQEEAKKKLALARLVEQLQGQGAVPTTTGVMGPQQPAGPIDTRTALARLGQITNDPTALINYDIHQNDPLRKIQLQKAQLDLQKAQRPALETYTIGNRVYRDDPYDNKPPEVLIDIPQTRGPQSPLGKIQADFEAGLIPKEAYEQAIGLINPEDEKGTIVPGLNIAPGAKPTKEDANTVKNVVQAKRQLDTLLGEYASMVDKFGYEPEGSNDAKDLGQKEAQIQLQMKTLEDLGALQAPDIEILARMMGSPVMKREGIDNFIPLPLAAIHPYKAFTTRDRSKSRVSDFRNYLDGRIDSVLKTRGYTPSKGSDLSNDPLGIFE